VEEEEADADPLMAVEAEIVAAVVAAVAAVAVVLLGEGEVGVVAGEEAVEEE